MGGRRRVSLVRYSIVFLLWTMPAGAQEPEGAKDHPMIPRMPNFEIGDFGYGDFEAATFPLPNDGEKTLEGRHWKIQYFLKEGARKSSELEILRNYINAFKAKNWKTELLQEPGHGVFSLSSGGSEIWCLIRPAAGGGEGYYVEIVERGGMAQSIELNAAALAKAINEAGSVALRGILFDTGKATIKAESQPVLQTIADICKGDPALVLEIQGHTDNVGQTAANRTLSQQRAEAVRQYLITKHGIAAARLSAVGLGDTKPVAPNTSEEGRGQNRRVELVKKGG